ncbi:MAG: glutathione S-transferase family protein [Myxococcaceae bacterium]|nr:glutathione S-transferase family protein [Myxococcaceae bacterium]
MLTLHIGNKNYSSWSLRPWVLLKARAIPFEEVLHPFDGKSAAGAFKSFSPSGRVPCLVDGPITVWDSLAIAEYVAEKHPGCWPADPAARAWARSATAEMHSGFGALRGQHSMSVGVRVEVKSRPPALLADIARVEELWAEGLARFGGPFLTGRDFTIVDAFFCPVAFRFQTYGVPTTSDYVKRLLDLPAMNEWYAAGLKEDFRDAGHDADVSLIGTVVKDLRAPAR